MNNIILSLTKHSSNISDKICPLHCHHYIGASSITSLLNVIFESDGNDFNNEANTYTSETELCFPHESERNKTKVGR